MRAVRLGSYSTVATVAGTPSLLRRKSMRRKRRLWPPPRKREVMRPLLLRPPLFDVLSVSVFSGRLPCDSSEKSGATRPRLPGVVALCGRRPMALDSLEELDVLAGGDGDDRLLPVGTLADVAAHALLFAAHHRGADRQHVDVPELLDGVADLDLVGVAGNLEQQLCLERLHVDLAVAAAAGLLETGPLLGEQGAFDDLFGWSHGGSLRYLRFGLRLIRQRARFDLLDRAGRDDEAGVVEDVVDVEAFGGQVLRLRQVTRRLRQVGVLLAVDQHRRFEAQHLEDAGQALGLGGVERQHVDHHQLLLLGAQRQRRDQRRPLHLLGHRVRVVARVRAEDLAAADVVGRAARALAGVAGPLLLVGLLAAAAHVGAGLGGVGPGPLGGALGVHHLPQEMLLHLGPEDGVGEADLPHGLALDIDDVDLHGESLGSGQVLISTSTPADRSSFMSASSVCCVGSRMSSSRLWVRISNCSRDFLWTGGDRSTQYLLILVGSGIGPAILAPVRLAVSTISPADWSRSLWS